jgi:hypothetical protein
MQPFDHVSASQIETFGDCRRKWWYQSILGIRPPPSPAAALGTAVHAALEAFILSGTAPDRTTAAGLIAAAGLPYARPAGTAPLQVELDLAVHPAGRGLALAGVAVHGRIDVLDVGADPITVQDWKTTSALKWAKTEDELRTNIQATLYSRFALAWADWHGRPAASVRFQHVVLTTKGAPLAKKTAVDLSRAHIDAEFAALAPTVGEMIDASKIETPAAVPATRSACDKYGGCFFRDRCNAIGAWGTPLRVAEHPARHMTRQEDTMSTNPAIAALRNMAAKKAALGASAPSTPTDTHPAPSDASATPKRPAVEAPAPPPTVASAVPGAGSAIVPPDAGSDDDWGTAGKPSGWGVESRALFEERAAMREFEGKQPRSLAEHAAEKEVRAIVADRKVAAVADSAPPVHTPAVAPASHPEAVVLAPSRDAAPPSADAPPSHPPSTGTATAGASTSSPRTPLVLYIDCYPLRGSLTPVVHLEDLIAPLQAKIAARAGVPIYSLIEYGKGPAQVAAALLENPPVGPVYVNSRLPASAAALEVLLPLAVGVVRGH